MKAIWNVPVLAESKDTVGLVSNHWYSKENSNKTYFITGNTQTACPLKMVGIADL